MKLLFFCLLFCAFNLKAQETERVVKAEIIVNAALDAVWEAWTTEAGVKTFFVPACKVEPRVYGAFEMYFNPNGAPGQRGGEGNVILAMQPKSMLSFTWNAPPHLPNVRQQRTRASWSDSKSWEKAKPK
jgi:uncharacterized protein YndB with AHSA1/START domain